MAYLKTGKIPSQTISRIVVTLGQVSINGHWLSENDLKTGSFYLFNLTKTSPKVEIKGVFRYSQLE